MTVEPERQRYCDYCDEYAGEFHDHEDDGPLCVCGHYEADHHISWFAASKYFPNGGKLVEECEYWGHNEWGGYEYTAEGKWRDHCQRFREISPQ